MAKGSGFWMAHLAAIEREATSTRAYAKRHGIAVKSLYYWRRKVKTGASAARGANQASVFVALRVAEPVEAPAPASCTLVLDSGMRLEMSSLPAPTWLAALVHAAQGAR